MAGNVFRGKRALGENGYKDREEAIFTYRCEAVLGGVPEVSRMGRVELKERGVFGQKTASVNVEKLPVAEESKWFALPQRKRSQPLAT